VFPIDNKNQLVSICLVLLTPNWLTRIKWTGILKAPSNRTPCINHFTNLKFNFTLIFCLRLLSNIFFLLTLSTKMKQPSFTNDIQRMTSQSFLPEATTEPAGLLLYHIRYESSEEVENGSKQEERGYFSQYLNLLYFYNF
jgi:hypothetical protein